MTNQVNQEFEKWAMQYYGETVMSVNPPQHYAHPNEYMLDTYRNAYEGWQARESEINSLKQRVEELQADNERLRELCAKIYADLQMGKACRDTMENLRAALSSSPTQSLAEHDNEVTAPYKKALEFAEYMAKSTEQFMIAINHLDEADREEDEETVEILQEKRGEHWRAVNCSIYEFRQRSDRALKATP